MTGAWTKWGSLFTGDGRYVVPATDLPASDPQHALRFIGDDTTQLCLQMRITSLTASGPTQTASPASLYFGATLLSRAEHGGTLSGKTAWKRRPSCLPAKFARSGLTRSVVSSSSAHKRRERPLARPRSTFWRPVSQNQAHRGRSLRQSHRSA